MNDKIELKPCPFCGGNDLSDDRHFVECFDCRATGPSHDPIPQRAAESWNRRHEAVEPLAVLADRKGYYSVEILPPTNDVEEWDISLCIELPDNEGSQREKWFEAPTYPACEAKARAFLMGLPDAGKEDK